MLQAKNVNNIVLIGFMGVGKTAVGRACACKLGWSFIDSDLEIEKLTGCSIADLFKNKGEDYFRQLESEIIERILRQSYQVVATGGGIVTLNKSRRILNVSRLRGSKVIWLQASTDVIWQRVKNNTKRPLLNTPDPMAKINHLLSKRNEFYQFAADYEIDTSELTIGEITEKIIKLVR